MGVMNIVAGRDVAIADLDRQQTATTWAPSASSHQRRINHFCVPLRLSRGKDDR